MHSPSFGPVGLPIYVARLPVGSIETRSLPTLTRSYPRRFTFYVAHPIRSVREQASATTTKWEAKSIPFKNLAADNTHPVHDRKL
jgi:hypothetical protein